MNKSNLLKGLYGITDANLFPDQPLMLKAVENALKGGMRILQYRDKNRPFEQQILQAKALKVLCVKYNALFIINDSVALAMEVAADGVHIGREDDAIKNARAQLGAQAIIGCSCYNSIPMAQQAVIDGADYVAFGRFFNSNTKPEADSAEISLITQAKQRLKVPVCAIGGITTENAPILIRQSVDMIAVIHDLFSVNDVEKKAFKFSALFA